MGNDPDDKNINNASQREEYREREGEGEEANNSKQRTKAAARVITCSASHRAWPNAVEEDPACDNIPPLARTSTPSDMSNECPEVPPIAASDLLRCGKLGRHDLPAHLWGPTPQHEISSAADNLRSPHGSPLRADPTGG